MLSLFCQSFRTFLWLVFFLWQFFREKPSDFHCVYTVGRERLSKLWGIIAKKLDRQHHFFPHFWNEYSLKYQKKLYCNFFPQLAISSIYRTKIGIFCACSVLVLPIRWSCCSRAVVQLYSFGVFLFHSAGANLFAFRILNCPKFRRRTTLGICLHYVPYTLFFYAVFIRPLFFSFCSDSAHLRSWGVETKR